VYQAGTPIVLPFPPYFLPTPATASDTTACIPVSTFYYSSFNFGTTTISGDADTTAQDSTKSIVDKALEHIDCEINILTLDWGPNFSCIKDYIIAVFFPSKDTMVIEIQKTIDVIRFTPPIGYVSVLYNHLVQSSASTSIASISFTYPDTLTPGGEQTITLPLSDIALVYDEVMGQPSPTYDGTYQEQLMYWWNLLWGLIFAFWLMAEFWGIRYWAESETRREVGRVKGNQRNEQRKADADSRFHKRHEVSHTANGKTYYRSRKTYEK